MSTRIYSYGKNRSKKAPFRVFYSENSNKDITVVATTTTMEDADFIMKACNNSFSSDLPIDELTEIRNQLYDSVPVGKLSAWDLVETIQAHLKRMDEFLDKHTKK